LRKLFIGTAVTGGGGPPPPPPLPGSKNMPLMTALTEVVEM
jgi:hypothetical protein